jgi:fido (protein-threonine AMPylation protein)
VSIHPFVNGNGRHARLMADLLAVRALETPRFSWGGADLSKVDTARTRYLEALRKADTRDFSALIAFLRS